MDGGEPAGGSAALASLIDGYGEVLVPDLKHYFGVDLRDLFHPVRPLSPRYVLSLVKWLPMSSAFCAEKRGGQQFREWDVDRYLAVASTNTLRAIQYMYVLAHIGPKGSKPKAPEPFPIPDRDKNSHAPKRGSFAGMAAAQLAAARRKREARG